MTCRVNSKIFNTYSISFAVTLSFSCNVCVVNFFFFCADYKAILSKGKVRCAGSSLFLKNRFGIGYHLK